MKTVNTGVPSLAPNHNMASTSQAIGGVPSNTVTSGRAIIEAVSEQHLPQVAPVTLRAERITQMLGMELQAAQVEQMLNALELTTTATGQGSGPSRCQATASTSAWKST